MAMDKQARLINERLEKIDQRLEKIETALGTGKISLEATAEVGDIEIPQLAEIEAKLDKLLAPLTAKAEAKPKGIGETKS